MQRQPGTLSTVMKLTIVALVALLVVLQYELWFSHGGLMSVLRLKHQIQTQHHTNQQLKDRNQALTADIKDLKNGNQAIEERARSELGMVKKGEVFYQVIKR